MNKEKCKELLKCKTCVYYNKSLVGDECVELEVRGVTENFGCVKHLSRGEKRGGCFSCKWRGDTRIEYYCRKEMLSIDNPFTVKDCYAYDKKVLKFYPYPEIVPETNKICLKIDMTLSNLIGSLLLVSLKEDIVIDNAVKYSVSLNDFYSLEVFNKRMYKIHKEKFENKLNDIFLDIEKMFTEKIKKELNNLVVPVTVEKIKIGIDENEWIKGLIELVKKEKISVIDLMNDFTNPIDLVKELTKQWLEYKKGDKK